MDRLSERAVPTRDRRDVRFWQVSELRGLQLLRGHYASRASALHTHDGYEIALIDRGAERLRQRGATHVARAGSVVVINPGDVHAESSVDARGWRTRAFFPSVRDLIDASSSASHRTRGTPFFSAPVIADVELAAMLRRLHRLLESRGRTLERETLANATASILVTRHAAQRPHARDPLRHHQAVRQARDLLEARAYDDVSLRELAAVSGVNAYHLVHLFTAELGMPPHAYQTYLRLRQARRLLTAGVSIAQAAAETGFADQSHLTRRFWRAYGVTPGQYVAAVGGDGRSRASARTCRTPSDRRCRTPS